MNVETNRVKERLFYMSCFDRFTKVKRNDETEASSHHHYRLTATDSFTREVGI